MIVGKVMRCDSHSVRRNVGRHETTGSRAHGILADEHVLTDAVRHFEC